MDQNIPAPMPTTNPIPIPTTIPIQIPFPMPKPMPIALRTRRSGELNVPRPISEPVSHRPVVVQAKFSFVHFT